MVSRQVIKVMRDVNRGRKEVPLALALGLGLGGPSDKLNYPIGFNY
jgi:hypothetical protein